MIPRSTVDACHCVPSRKESGSLEQHSPGPSERTGSKSETLESQRSRPTSLSSDTSMFRKYLLDSRHQEKKEAFFLWHSSPHLVLL